MLRQYARASRGKLTLNIIDPRPDTPEEEKATAAGIQPQLIPTTGEQIQFGLVAIKPTNKKPLLRSTPSVSSSSNTISRSSFTASSRSTNGNSACSPASRSRVPAPKKRK